MWGRDAARRASCQRKRGVVRKADAVSEIDADTQPLKRFKHAPPVMKAEPTCAASPADPVLDAVKSTGSSSSCYSKADAVNEVLISRDHDHDAVSGVPVSRKRKHDAVDVDIDLVNARAKKRVPSTSIAAEIDPSSFPNAAADEVIDMDSADETFVDLAGDVGVGAHDTTIRSDL